MIKEKKNKVRLVLTVVVLFSALHFFFKYRQKEITSDGLYTVAKVTGYYKALTSSPEIYFTYFVDGKKIRIPTKFDGEYSSIENKFFRVRYSAANPSWGEIQLNHPIIDTAEIRAAGLSFTRKKKNKFRN